MPKSKKRTSSIPHNNSLNKVKAKIEAPRQSNKTMTPDDIIKELVENVRLKTYKASSTCFKVAAYTVLGDKFGFTKEQVKEFREYMDNIGDSIIKGYVNFPDLIQLCMDEYDLPFTEEEISYIDPALVKSHKTS